jgi:hypothetical protein
MPQPLRPWHVLYRRLGRLNLLLNSVCFGIYIYALHEIEIRTSRQLLNSATRAYKNNALPVTKNQATKQNRKNIRNCPHRGDLAFGLRLVVKWKLHIPHMGSGMQ